MVVLYRCVCTRNYAEWRASWSNEKSDEPVAAQLVMEAVPMVLDGHVQEVECLVTDGSSVVSSCLGGQLKVWDAATGEQLANIDRKMYINKKNINNNNNNMFLMVCRYFGGISKTTDLSVDYDDSMLSDYESGSPPSRDENSMSFPSLQKKINTNFTNLKLEPVNQTKKGCYDFGDHYRQLYLNHDPHDVVVRHRNSNNSNFSNAVNTTDTAKWIINQASVNLLGEQQQFVEMRTRHRNSSIGERSPTIANSQNNSMGTHNGVVPPIWCIDYMDNLIVLGCANGRLEFWEGTTGKLKVNIT